MTTRHEIEERRHARMLLAAAYHLLSGDVVPDARLGDAFDTATDAAVIIGKLRNGREISRRAA